MFNQRQEQFRSPPLTTVDLGIGLSGSDDHWGIDLQAKNVFNKISEDFASPSVDPRFGGVAYLAAVSRRRTLTLSAHFKY